MKVKNHDYGINTVTVCTVDFVKCLQEKDMVTCDAQERRTR